MKTIWSWLWPWSKQSGRIGSDATTVSMNSGRNNFETSLDDNRFSNIQMSLPSEGVNQSQQLNRMPALLRLNSVGEVSRVHHSEDSHTKKVGKGVTPTGIQFSSGNSLSSPADSSSISFGLGTQQSFLQRMASLKALSPSKSPYRNNQSTSAVQFMKSRPLSEPKVTSQSGYYSDTWRKKAALSASIDSFADYLSKGIFDISARLQKNCFDSDSVSMDSCTTPCLSQIHDHGYSGSAGSPSHTVRRSLSAGSSVSVNIHGIITSAVSRLSPRVVESSYSAVTAASTHCTQSNSHSTTSAIPAKSMLASHSVEDSKSLSSMDVCESSTLQIAERSHSEIACNDKSESLPITLTSVASSSPFAAAVARNMKAEFVNSDLSVAGSGVESNDSLKASALSVSGDHSYQSSSESCSRIEEDTSGMDNFNKTGELFKSNPSSNLEGSSHCPLKHIVSVSSVLFSPRKTVKKGRPSSKKQKKRQREKRKHASQATAEEKSITDDPSACGSEQHQQAFSQDSATTACTFSMSGSENDSFDFSSDIKHSQPKQSTPVKAQSKHPAIACFVIAPDSGSEETDDDECDNEDSSDWSADESSGPCISPIKGAAFNVALNLDSIFKQKTIPSLKSVLSAEDSESDSEPSTSSPSAKRKGLCLTLSVSLSEEEDSSVEFSASPRPSASSDCALFGFTTGLSIDALISKKPTVNNCKNQKSTRLKKATSFDFDHVASHSSEESCEFDDSSQAHGLALGVDEMKEINAKWDRDYPTAGFRTCCSSPSEVVNNPNIKVRFATEPHLQTVYEVGTEERGGTWHHYALDRERFEKRIKDIGKVVLPVLQEDHRVQMLKRNQDLEQQMEQ